MYFTNIVFLVIFNVFLFFRHIGPLLYHWVSDLEDNNDPRYDQSVEVRKVEKEEEEEEEEEDENDC